MKVTKCGISFDVTEDGKLDFFWRDHYSFWEHGTFDWIMPRLDKDKTFIDIGSWEGPISLVTHNYSKQCVCFEPDPTAYSKLINNITINSITNMLAENKAVSSENTIKIGHPDGMGTGGTTFTSDKNCIDCETISISEILRKYALNDDNISILKIDTEGYECKILQDPILQSLNVNMHISMHPGFFQGELKTQYFDDMRKFFSIKNIAYIQDRDFYEVTINKI
jgi:FkbM family methyltransferase